MPLSIALATLMTPAILSTSMLTRAEETSLTFAERGGREVVGIDRLRYASLSETKPESLTKVPDGLVNPRYGVLEVTAVKGRVYHVIVVEPAEGATEGTSQVYVDANGDGDMTNDPAPTWNRVARPTREGSELHDHLGGVMLTFGSLEGTGSAVWSGHVLLKRFDTTDPRREAMKTKLVYQRDYAWKGRVTVGASTYNAILDDASLSGDFRGVEGKTPEGRGSVRLMLDVNQNGSFDRRGENFDVSQPFKIGGKVFEVTGLGADGSGLKVVASEKDAVEVLPPPDLRPGKPVLAFDAKDLDGKDVHFPGDYKGKVVLLDFWATWCGPCMVEMPNVSKAYDALHSEGFEVLAVSLDRENAESKIRETAAARNMPWPQIYDGKYWEAKIAQSYGIFSIPQAFLVDGDTGAIIATGDDVRREKLMETIKKALEAKKKRG